MHHLIIHDGDYESHSPIFVECLTDGERRHMDFLLLLYERDIAEKKKINPDTYDAPMFIVAATKDASWEIRPKWLSVREFVLQYIRQIVMTERDSVSSLRHYRCNICGVQDCEIKHDDQTVFDAQMKRALGLRRSEK